MLNINSSYIRYMAETEGITSITSTRQTNINAAINDFVFCAKQGLDINSPDLQNEILKNYHLHNLSLEEKRNIIKKVQKALY